MRDPQTGAVRAWLLAAVLVLAAGAGAALFWLRAGPAPASLLAATPGQIEAGRVLYAQHCAACHGANLEGEQDWRRRKPSGRLPAPPHDDSGHTWHHPDELLIAITREGLRPPLAPDGYESDMPGFAGVLDDAQIHAVLGFIASRWSPESRAHQARVTSAYRNSGG